MVLDPMLATGGFGGCRTRGLRRWGVPKLKVLAVIARRKGSATSPACPQAQVFVCAIDP